MKVNKEKDGTIKSFEFLKGEISVHKHIHHPGRWVITCRKLSIHGEILCDDSIKNPEEIKNEISEHLDEIIMKHQNVRDRLINKL